MHTTFFFLLKSTHLFIGLVIFWEREHKRRRRRGRQNFICCFIYSIWVFFPQERLRHNHSRLRQQLEQIRARQEEQRQRQQQEEEEDGDGEATLDLSLTPPWWHLTPHLSLMPLPYPFCWPERHQVHLCLEPTSAGQKGWMEEGNGEGEEDFGVQLIEES